LLSDSENLEKTLLDNALKEKYSIVDIRQGYISKGLRLREYSWTMENGILNEPPRKELVRTLKLPLKDLSECLEWEDTIIESEFNLAWPMTKEVIVKTRYVIFSDENIKWELDIFKNNGYTYLQMAECEVYNGSEKPTAYPDIVKEHLIHIVDDGDDRFKNRQLSNVNKVKKLLKKIRS